MIVLCSATIITAKWRMFIQRKKYRQLREACKLYLPSLLLPSPPPSPPPSLPLFPSLSHSFPPFSLMSLHPFTHFLPPSTTPSSFPRTSVTHFSPSSLSYCVCQALEEDQGTALHPQTQDSRCGGPQVSQSTYLTSKHRRVCSWFSAGISMVYVPIMYV